MGLYIGTAGWSYPSGAGRWDGVFYPEGLADRDKLAFYARFFNAVEVNSSFYRPLGVSTVRAWVTRTPPEFRFCIKLFQKFTHPRMYEEASGEEAQVTEADFQLLEHGLEPLVRDRRLGALLAQFPPSFKAEPPALDHLERLLRRLVAYPLAVELRHRSWTDSEQGRELLAEYGAAWVMIDEPKFKTSIGDVPLTSNLGYLRFHGRNYEEWWEGDRETRYDYLYRADEQAELAATVREVSAKTADTYVFYNNHFRAKAVVNALDLKRRLGQSVDAPLPPTLLTAYPFLSTALGAPSERPGGEEP